MAILHGGGRRQMDRDSLGRQQPVVVNWRHHSPGSRSLVVPSLSRRRARAPQSLRRRLHRLGGTGLHLVSSLRRRVKWSRQTPATHSHLRQLLQERAGRGHVAHLSTHLPLSLTQQDEIRIGRTDLIEQAPFAPKGGRRSARAPPRGDDGAASIRSGPRAPETLSKGHTVGQGPGHVGLKTFHREQLSPFLGCHCSARQGQDQTQVRHQRGAAWPLVSEPVGRRRLEPGRRWRTIQGRVHMVIDKRPDAKPSRSDRSRHREPR